MNPANTKIANVVLLLCRKYTQDNCVAVSRYSFLPLPACMQQMFSNFSVTRLRANTSFPHSLAAMSTRQQVLCYRQLHYTQLYKQLLSHHHPLCSKPPLHIWWTPHFFRPDLICLQILLLPYPSPSQTQRTIHKPSDDRTCKATKTCP